MFVSACAEIRRHFASRNILRSKVMREADDFAFGKPEGTLGSCDETGSF